MPGAGAGDDDTGAGTGTGSNPGSGPGSQTGTGSNNPATARVDVTVDKTAVATELKTANPIEVTVTGSGGFRGEVGLTAAVVDASNTAIPGWTVDLSAPSVTLTADGTATAMATVHVPPMSAGLTGMVKITSTSAATLGTPAAASTLTAANQVTFAMKFDATTKKCLYPADGGTGANPVVIGQATKIRFFNTGTAAIVVHSGGPISHQGRAPNGGPANSTTASNTAYEQTPTGPGVAAWYCHSPDGVDPGAAGPKIVVR